MHCSFCQSSDHNIRNCNCDHLNFRISEIQTHVEYCKNSPIRTQPSPAEEFYSILNRYSAFELKAIAARYKIAVSRVSEDMLKIRIVREVYYRQHPMLNSPSPFIEPDAIYLKYLDRRISGVSYEYANSLYTAEHLQKQEQVRETTLEYNLAYLRNFSTTFTRKSPLYGYILYLIDRDDRPDSISEYFGKYIDIKDLFDYLPCILDNYFSLAFVRHSEEHDEIDNADDNDEDEDEWLYQLQDIVYAQKLAIQCEYQETLTMEDECIVCCDTICNTKLNCNHEFCMTCIETSIGLVLNDHRKQASCPICRAGIVKVISNYDLGIAGFSLMVNNWIGSLGRSNK